MAQYFMALLNYSGTGIHAVNAEKRAEERAEEKKPDKDVTEAEKRKQNVFFFKRQLEMAPGASAVTEHGIFIGDGIKMGYGILMEGGVLMENGIFMGDGIFERRYGNEKDRASFLTP